MSRVQVPGRLAWASVPALVAVLLLFAPYASFDVPGILPGPVDSPGSLQLLALCMLFGAVAISYDLLYGFTGLLSFGHALYVAVGAYTADLLLSKAHWGFASTLLVVAAVGLVLPLVLGAISLRVGGIAFAMVTLAFAQAGSVLVYKNPNGWTGGEEGLGLSVDRLPAGLVGVLNTKHLYWVALGLLVVTYAITWWVTTSAPGRVWEAIRENERRVEVLGLRPYAFKLLSFVIASFLATAGGVVYLLLLAGATPSVTSADFTLGLLVMVVLGGAGTRWGPAVGATIYVLLDNRLADLTGSGAVADLPGFLRTPLSEPLFVLGLVFIAVVFFVPGGVAGSVRRLRAALTGPRTTGRNGAPPTPREAQARRLAAATKGGGG
jgi:branched-chain amino acid transport system permease protein